LFNAVRVHVAKGHSVCPWMAGWINPSTDIRLDGWTDGQAESKGCLGLPTNRYRERCDQMQYHTSFTVDHKATGTLPVTVLTACYMCSDVDYNAADG